MKLWILGKKGLVGSALIQLCEQKSLPYVATSHTEVDITHKEQLLSFVEKAEPTHIINCAAYTDVDRAEMETDLSFAVNREGPKYLGSIAAKNRIKVLHLSTDYIFDGQKKTPYLESDPPHPLNQYGKSKLEGELRLLEELSTASIVRTSWVFGRQGKSFISSVVRLLQENQELKVVADQMSRPTYCLDLAHTLLLLLDKRGIFHFANQGACSRFAIAQWVKLELEKRQLPCACQTLIPITSSAIASRPLYSVLSTQKIETECKIVPRSWEEAMGEMLWPFSAF